MEVDPETELEQYCATPRCWHRSHAHTIFCIHCLYGKPERITTREWLRKQELLVELSRVDENDGETEQSLSSRTTSW